MFGVDLRVARIVWTVAVIAAGLYTLYAIRMALLIVIFAVFFSYLIYPLVQFVESRAGSGAPRLAIVTLVFAFVVGAVGLAVMIFGPQISDQAALFGKEFLSNLDIAKFLDRFPTPRFLEPLKTRLLAFAEEIMRPGNDKALPVVQQVGAGVAYALASLVYVVVIPILSFLLIMEAPVFKAQFLSWLDRSSARFWVGIAEDLSFLLTRYVRALLLLSLATFVCYSIVLTLLKVPFSLLMSGVAALLEIIPVFGPLAAAFSIFLIAALNGYEHLLWLVGFFVLYRLFQDYVLNPYLMSEGVEVSPLLVIFGLLAGEELGGVAGIFLSVPALAALKIVLNRIHRNHMAAAAAAANANAAGAANNVPAPASQAPPQIGKQG